MKYGAFLLSFAFILGAIPALARADSAVQNGNRFRSVFEGGRAVVAVAAGSILFLLAVRMR